MKGVMGVTTDHIGTIVSCKAGDGELIEITINAFQKKFALIKFPSGKHAKVSAIKCWSNK